MDAKLLKTLMKTKPEESNNRLQSLRLPRDLSLGGTKPKKVFVPNVNVVRNKDKAKEVIKNLDRTRKEKVKNEPKNRSFVDGQRFVQSSSIFSDGSAEQRKSTAHSERSHCGKSDSDPSGGISVPTYKKNMINKQKEDVILDELVSHDDEFAEEKMPLMPVFWQNIEKKGSDIVVKTETQMNGDLGRYNGVKTKQIVSYFHKMEKEGEHSRLALFKLPVSLAGKGLSDDPTITKIFDYPLNVMLEGKIGTLQIKSSGKMYLRIGHIKYLLESTDNFSNNEAVGSFAEASFGKDISQFALFGNVEQSFVVNPIWQHLLQP